jgi:hypothetical protein
VQVRPPRLEVASPRRRAAHAASAKSGGHPGGLPTRFAVENARETCGFRVDACAPVCFKSARRQLSRHDFLCSHNPPLAVESSPSGPGCGAPRFSTFPQHSSSQQALSALKNQKSFCCDDGWFLFVENGMVFRKNLPGPFWAPGRLTTAFPQCRCCDRPCCALYFAEKLVQYGSGRIQQGRRLTVPRSQKK